jgi:phenylalanyl-tRNA synthetase alpha chain
MSQPTEYEKEKQKALSIEEAFEREFERFAPFAVKRELRLSPNEMADLAVTMGGGDVLADDFKALLDVRTRYLGRKSEWANLKKTIGRLSPEGKAHFGQFLMFIEVGMKDKIAEAERTLQELIESARIARESIDVTMPGRRPRSAHLHPITLMRQRIEDIFVSLGYAVEDDREIETDFYNFDALNIPAGHPARDPQDTFYTTDGFALRSQTSTVQIHALQRRGAPVRMIAPGRVFRRDTPDPTHNPMFFQVEGLCVDHGITMAHLKGTLQEFVHRLFGPETRTRFRPSYFPFTEPSAEVDYSCFNCGGAGCRICKWCGWIELGGSGMVHPNVLHAANVDSEEFTGFAFGLGIDRTCALIYELDDIRLLFENDVRFLEQFR